MKGKKNYITILSLLSALIIALFIIVMQAKENRFLRANLPYLLPKEKITSFDLVGADNERIDVDALKGKPSLIYIFQTPCSACNDNVLFWKKIAGILKDDINVFGIVLSDYGEMVSFTEEARLNFKVYYPVEPIKFKENLKIRLNIAQTIVYFEDEVFRVNMGNLNGEDYTQILKEIKALLRRKDS